MGRWKAHTGLAGWTGSPDSPVSTAANKTEEYKTLGRSGLPVILALRGNEHLSLSSNCSLNSGPSKSHKTVIKFMIFYHHLSDERREF